MRQVFYIEADEEIISVVDRLRISRADENVFVFPQGALVLRSIVNLYLFEREAKKRNKQIAIVTQDETGRLMAEKVGIPVQVQLEKGAGDISASTLIQQETQQQWTYPQPQATDAPSHTPLRSLGSEDFFGVQQSPFPASPPVLPTPSEAQTFASRESAAVSEHRSPEYAQTFAPPVQSPLPPVQVSIEMPPFQPAKTVSRPTIHTDSLRRVVVKDRSPHYLTALNSRMTPQDALMPTPEPRIAPLITPQQSVYPVASSARAEGGRLSLSSSFAPEPTPSRPEIRLTPSNFQTESFETSVSRKTSSFFATPPPAAEVPAKPFAKEPRKAELGIHETPPKGGPSKTWATWLASALVALVVVGLGIGAVILLPRADIAVTFKTTTAETDARFEAGTPAFTSPDQTQQLQTRLIQAEKTITKTFPATGSNATADARVHGKVTITNSYSADPQTLIATTRVLSSGGKLFRLKDTITVPGMQGGQPGAIDAEVIADQVGGDSAVDAGNFTIPGLDGTPKQGKFAVVSKQAFVGGGKQSGALPSVSSADVVKAKQVVEKELRDELEADLRSQLSAGEQILPEAIEITTVTADTTPLVGTATDTFDYTWQVKARTLTFSEESVRTMLRDRFLSQAGDTAHLTLDAAKMTFEYGQPEADMSQGILRFSVHARSALQPAANIETLKQEFLGKSSKELESVVSSHPEIASIEVNFGKMSLWQTIPPRPSQVTVTLKYLGE
jgi:hypothetical protein